MITICGFYFSDHIIFLLGGKETTTTNKKKKERFEGHLHKPIAFTSYIITQTNTEAKHWENMPKFHCFLHLKSFWKLT